MINRYFFIFQSLIIAISLSTLEAQDRTIEINVAGNFRPVSSQGLLMTSQSVLSKPVIKVENLENQNMLVSIPYKPAEIEDGALATAILLGPDGEIAFGDIKMITDSVSTKSFLGIPACSKDPQVPASLDQQVGLLESLVAIRAARREAHQLRLKQVLTPTFIEKLRRLEKGFGLRYSSPLSDGLSHFELLDRLSRLSNAIKNYQSTKK